MVSEVQGRLRPGLDGWDALQALFPGGSITGCPKTVTVASIDELEGEPRRAWTGSLGHHDPRTGVSAWNILIRTLEAERDDAGEWRARVKAGGGLVIESDPEREVAEAKWKARGLLEDTLVIWGGEFGRTPMSEKRATPGRNHHIDAFSMWFAGGGIKPGNLVGETDEFGHKAVENVVNHYDYHATLLHLLGLDPDRLGYEHNGRERKLISQNPGRIVKEILA